MAKAKMTHWWCNCCSKHVVYPEIVFFLCFSVDVIVFKLKISFSRALFLFFIWETSYSHPFLLFIFTFKEYLKPPIVSNAFDRYIYFRCIANFFLSRLLYIYFMTLIAVSCRITWLFQIKSNHCDCFKHTEKVLCLLKETNCSSALSMVPDCFI